MWWRVFIIFLAFALIGAHFLRYGQTIWSLLFIAAPLLLFIRHRYSARILQMSLIFCAFGIWGISGYDAVQMRISMDAPWLRLALIMSAVTLFTLAAAFCCQGIIKRRTKT